MGKMLFLSNYGGEVAMTNKTELEISIEQAMAALQGDETHITTRKVPFDSHEVKKMARHSFRDEFQINMY